MKKIFKKNQIIITALAIMIIIAGYLNFSQRNAAEEANIGEGEVVDYDTNGSTLLDNINDSDLVDLIKDGKDVEDVADISDEDIGQQVSDTGELVVDSESGEGIQTDAEASDQGNNEDSNEQTPPGEAVLVSTNASPDFFINARVSREQIRAKNKETLMGILESASVSEEDKSKATQEIIKLTSISERENSTETLLEAKGYSDAVVSISDEEVSVIVNAVSLNDQDVAQIEDITKRETGVDIKHIVIAPVVVTE